MALKWMDAHDWVENHTKATDKDLSIPNNFEIEKIEEEIEHDKKIYNLKQKELDNILMHSKNKLIDHCVGHINKSFKMCDITKDLPEIKPHHYARIYELAKKELCIKGYNLSKNGKSWYICTKAVK